MVGDPRLPFGWDFAWRNGNLQQAGGHLHRAPPAWGELPPPKPSSTGASPVGKGENKLFCNPVSEASPASWKEKKNIIIEPVND